SAFSLHRYADHRALHSFPTRRSSDLSRLIETGRYEDAKSATDAALARQPGNARLRFIKSAILARQGQTGPAIEVLEQLTADFPEDRKSTRLNSSHVKISYAVFCLKKK